MSSYKKPDNKNNNIYNNENASLLIQNNNNNIAAPPVDDNFNWKIKITIFYGKNKKISMYIENCEFWTDFN